MSDSGVGAGGHTSRPRTGGPSEAAGVRPTHDPRRGERVLVLLIAAALAVSLVSVGVLYRTLDGGEAPAAAAVRPVLIPTATPTTATASTPVPTVTVTVTAEPAPVPELPAPAEAAVPVTATKGAPPVQVVVPDLQIDESLLGLQVTPEGRMQVPESAEDIGWWTDGPAPGDPGAALLVGHVDSTEGPGVFYHLSGLQKGAEVAVRRADGVTVRFAVTGTQVFAKDDFPDDLVYRTEGKPSLHLVTCGGTFDRETGHYRDNVVVFADLIQDTPDPVSTPGEDPAVTPPPQPPPSAPAGVTVQEQASADMANAAIAEAARSSRAGAPEAETPEQAEGAGR